MVLPGRLQVPSAGPWLFGTARNAMLNAHRGQRRQTAVAVRVMEYGGDDSYDGLTQAEERMDLVAAWRQLPAADQEVLALHVWEGLTDRDAATVLGCSRARPTRCAWRAPNAVWPSWSARPVRPPPLRLRRTEGRDVNDHEKNLPRLLAALDAASVRELTEAESSREEHLLRTVMDSAASTSQPASPPRRRRTWLWMAAGGVTAAAAVAVVGQAVLNPPASGVLPAAELASWTGTPSRPAAASSEAVVAEKWAGLVVRPPLAPRTVPR
jgi:hypothetical protein